MAVLHSNFKSGTITNNPLASGGTSVTSSGFSNLPTVTSPDVLWLVLDPAGVGGTPELVKVTNHSAASTTCTVTRGQQTTLGGSTAREHVTGTVWRHVYTAEEIASVLTSVAAVEVDIAALEAADTALDARLDALDRATASVATAEATSSTSYVDLTTPGPAATLTTGTLVEVTLVASMTDSGGAGGHVSVAVSGATTTAAADASSMKLSHAAAGDLTTVTFPLTVTAGSNTFTTKYRASSGTATFRTRSLIVKRLN